MHKVDSRYGRPGRDPGLLGLLAHVWAAGKFEDWDGARLEDEGAVAVCRHLPGHIVHR